MGKMSIEQKEKEDEIYGLVKERIEKVKELDAIKYNISIARAELKQLKVEEKADKE